MPVHLKCPFFLIFFKTDNIICVKSECELWSSELGVCSINVGMHGLVSIADAIRGLSEHIKANFPDGI